MTSPWCWHGRPDGFFRVPRPSILCKVFIRFGLGSYLRLRNFCKVLILLVLVVERCAKYSFQTGKAPEKFSLGPLAFSLLI